MIGEDLELDDPKNSSQGKNPDILVTIDGERWGFACKVPNPMCSEPHKKMQSIMRNVCSGMEQIRRSSVSKGQVVVNLRNLFDHDRLNPFDSYTERMSERHFRVFDLDTIDRKLKHWGRVLGNRFRKECTTPGLLPDLTYATSGYGFIGYLETGAWAKTPEGTFPTPINFVTVFGLDKAGDPVNGPVRKLAHALNAPRSAPLPGDVVTTDFE